MVLVKWSVYCCHTSRGGDGDDAHVCVVNTSMHNVNVSMHDQATLRRVVCFFTVKSL